MTTTPCNYAAMSKTDLIGIIETQKRRLQTIDNIVSLPNTTFAPGEKLAWVAAQPFLNQEKPDARGLVRLPIDKIAARIGMSESTASRYAANLVERFDAQKEQVPYVTKKGQKLNLTYINPSDPLWVSPWDVELPEEKARTINGNECPHCHSSTLKVKKRTIAYQEIRECETCKYRKVTEVLHEDEPLEPMEFIPGQKAPQPEDLLTENEKPENLGVLTPQVLPLADCDATTQLAILNAAAQLLLEIAGPGPEAQHIEMPGDGDDKYKTIHRRLVAGDLRAHIYGHKTKGATLQHEGDQTRAITFDADTPEDLQKLKQAARQLRIADFKPLLELSPVPAGHDHAGGGKLWIIFDALVDAYSALQTAYQYAPMLREIKEYWPRPGNNRVRLPGGKYVKPGFAAWCPLADADGNELSHDGPGAAAVLLARQTPASVVREYDKLITEPPQQPAKRETQAGEYLEKNDVRRVVDDFNASHSWEEIAGPFNRSGKFAAVWRGDRTPNCAVNRRTDLAKDFARPDEPAMDKYDVWCRIEGGATWQEFRRRDLAERCEQYRQRCAPMPPPARQTICCNAGWHWTGEKYVCATCHGKQERRAS